jgi:hypothetical protein
MRTFLASALLFVHVVGGTTAVGQERFSFFQPSTVESVERMLRLADLRDDDVLLDLGSGDGLIPITAARMNGKMRGLGVDIDPDLVAKSTERARSEGVGDRVRFLHRNAFDADLSEATVVTMWLFPELMQLLRPIILERARPGTRVLTSTWKLGNWEPDEVDEDSPHIYKWTVPAKVDGAWRWTLDVGGTQFNYACFNAQQFQKVEGAVRVADRREVLTDVLLRGEDFSFTLRFTLTGLGLTDHKFIGKVRGDRIQGTVEVTPPDRQTVSVPWVAERTERSEYFAHTGTEMFKEPASSR